MAKMIMRTFFHIIILALMVVVTANYAVAKQGSPRGSATLIHNEYKSGKIDIDGYFYLRFLAIFDPNNLPPQFRGDPGFEIQAADDRITELLSDVHQNMGRISPATWALYEPLFLRPTDINYQDNFKSGSQVYPHYVGDGALPDMNDGGAA